MRRSARAPAVPIPLTPILSAPYTLLFSHGNAEDLGYLQEGVQLLAHHLNVNLLAYDYTGYGLSSQSEPSEEARP